MKHIKTYPPNQRITHWIERLEWQTSALLEDVVLDDLSAKDRLTLATKYLQQMQRFLQLSQQIEVSTKSTEEQAVIESMKAWMRGEPNVVGTAVDHCPCPPTTHLADANMGNEPNVVGMAVDLRPCAPPTPLAAVDTRGEPNDVGTAVDLIDSNKIIMPLPRTSLSPSHPRLPRPADALSPVDDAIYRSKPQNRTTPLALYASPTPTDFVGVNAVDHRPRPPPLTTLADEGMQ